VEGTSQSQRLTKETMGCGEAIFPHRVLLEENSGSPSKILARGIAKPIRVQDNKTVTIRFSGRRILLYNTVWMILFLTLHYYDTSQQNALMLWMHNTKRVLAASQLPLDPKHSIENVTYKCSILNLLFHKSSQGNYRNPSRLSVNK